MNFLELSGHLQILKRQWPELLCHFVTIRVLWSLDSGNLEEWTVPSTPEVKVAAQVHNVPVSQLIQEVMVWCEEELLLVPYRPLQFAYLIILVLWEN